ncbi:MULTISPECIES: iron ABC transporter permease [Burkholderia]|uniref:Iron ABC transporter n=1 Tax=Burkholderia paludis TaxID=1506587 RepID=A0A6J5DQ32_9BURK|nr:MULTISPECIES: iron ABC transporter permease [Burkholderia]CAB3754966.1 Petrobactin import system permease protein FpuB [Burkholderia paludis]VWB33795.1 iron ABC transporter [Burkholderia paludis]
MSGAAPISAAARVRDGAGFAALVAASVVALVAMLAWNALFAYGAPVERLAALADPHGAAWRLFVDAQLPRVLAGALAGAAFGIAGAMLQAVTHNPLASSDLLGVTTGAQLGLVATFIWPALPVSPAIFAGGLAAAALTFGVAGGWRASPLRMTLAGAAVALALNALLTLVLTLSDDSAVSVVLWSTGSLQQIGADGVAIACVLALPAFALVLLLARGLDLIRLGDDQASLLGLRPQALRALCVLLATWLTAVAIGRAGPVGFVGLIAPNLLRSAGVHRPSRLVPLSALWGAVLLLVADAVVIAAGDDGLMPLGVTTALIGTPVLLMILRRTAAPTPARLMMGAVERTARTRAAPRGFFIAGALALVVVALLTASHGASGVPFGVLVRDFIAGRPEALEIVGLRVPRTLIAMLGGALLGASGMLLQGMTRNPLAGPEMFGGTAAASLVMLIVMLVAPGATASVAWWGVPLAWAGCAAALGFVVALNWRTGLEPMRVTLTGLACAALLAAVLNVVLLQFHVHITQALSWLVGSTYAQGWGALAAMLPWALASLPFAWRAGRWLELLSLGDASASALGLDVPRARLALLAVASLMTATAVAGTGPVAFAGLIAPHAARLAGLRGQRAQIGAAMLIGALLLGVADCVGRVAFAPRDLPLGILTAALGAPYFLWLLARSYLRRAR